MKYTHIIWDFNGTLFQDIDAGIESVNTMLAERGIKTIQNVEEYREIFRFPVIDYYRDLGFDFDAEPFDVLAPIWIDLYNKNSANAPLQECAIDALEAFRDLGISQLLLSATELNMLKGQLDSLGITKYFDEIMGLDNIHAHSKQAIAIDWMARNPSARPLFIGDSLHDAEVASAVNADCILVANGHQSRKRLKASGFPVFSSLSDVLKNIKKVDFVS